MTIREWLRLMRDRDNPVRRYGRRPVALTAAVLLVLNVVAIATPPALAGSRGLALQLLMSIPAAAVSAVTLLLIRGRRTRDDFLQDLLLTPLSRSEVVAGLVRPVAIAYLVIAALWAASFAIQIPHMPDPTDPMTPILALAGLTFLGGVWIGVWAIALRRWLTNPRAIWSLTLGTLIEGGAYVVAVAYGTIALLVVIGSFDTGNTDAPERIGGLVVAAWLPLVPLRKLRQALAQAPARLFRRVDPERSAQEHWLAAERDDASSWLLPLRAIGPPWRHCMVAALQAALVQVIVVAAVALVASKNPGSAIARGLVTAPGLCCFAVLTTIFAVRRHAAIAGSVPMMPGGMVRSTITHLYALALPVCCVVLLVSGPEFRRGLGAEEYILVLMTFLSAVVAGMGAIFITLLPALRRRFFMVVWATLALAASIQNVVWTGEESSISIFAHAGPGALAAALLLISGYTVALPLEGLQRLHQEAAQP